MAETNCIIENETETKSTSSTEINRFLEKVNVLETLLRLAKGLKSSKLSRHALRAVEDDSKKIAKYLDTTEIEACIFSIVFILNYNDDDTVGIRDLARYIDVSTADALCHYKKLKELQERGYFLESNRRRRRGVAGADSFFSVETELCENIIDNLPAVVIKNENEKTIFDLLRFVGENYFELEEPIPTMRIEREIEQKEKDFEEFSQLKKLQTSLDSDSRIIFYDLCYDRVFHDCDSSLLRETLMDYYGRRRNTVKEKLNLFKNEKHPLQKLGLCELEKNDNLHRPKIRVTNKGLETILGQDAELYIDELSAKDLLDPKKIAKKELFYSDKINDQINLLQNSVEEKKFKEIQKRLEKERMPKGICVLLYGHPGTGKTETVYQIAKSTKRKIYHVDISQTKSCWFGESEKKIKEIFTNYKQFCKKCRSNNERLPILLFNEADAVFAKRKDSNSSNVAQTENAIQNIILEEMENLDGILIATTNLENNFDAAFERRFLFKIKFEKPTIQARSKIWMSKIKTLSEKDAETLAEEFDFSGGEIDNIVRKSVMENLISGDEVTLEQLRNLCKTEKIGSDSTKIGFLA